MQPVSVAKQMPNGKPYCTNVRKLTQLSAAILNAAYAEATDLKYKASLNLRRFEAAHPMADPNESKKNVLTGCQLQSTHIDIHAKK
jgi:hypothetical protein